MGRPSIPLGVYFCCLFVGYFEGLRSERGIAWRCADSLSLRRFLGVALGESTPDHSTLSRTRKRFSVEIHQQVFDWVLARLGEAGLVCGRTLGIDASTLEASAVMRSLERRDIGQTLLALVFAGIGCSSAPCTGWTYGGCCADNKAQFIRTCYAPDGGERIERRCTGMCGS